MPGTHESCNKIRLSHTSALGELFIADECKKAQAQIFKSCGKFIEQVPACRIRKNSSVLQVQMETAY
jgi:hypothetical protein